MTNARTPIKDPHNHDAHTPCTPTCPVIIAMHATDETLRAQAAEGDQQAKYELAQRAQDPFKGLPR